MSLYLYYLINSQNSITTKKYHLYIF